MMVNTSVATTMGNQPPSMNLTELAAMNETSMTRKPPTTRPARVALQPKRSRATA